MINYKRCWEDGDKNQLVLSVGFLIVVIGCLYLIYIGLQVILNIIIVFFALIGVYITGLNYIESCPEIEEND